MREALAKFVMSKKVEGDMGWRRQWVKRQCGERPEHFQIYWVLDFGPMESEGIWATLPYHLSFQMACQSGKGMANELL